VDSYQCPRYSGGCVGTSCGCMHAFFCGSCMMDSAGDVTVTCDPNGG
jgi:hypothetical protein